MKIKKNYSLRKHSTYNTKAFCKIAYFPENINDIKTIFSYYKKFYVIGSGSNILFSDKYIIDPIVFTSKLSNYKIIKEKKNIILSAECGLPIHKIQKICINHSLSGLEFCSGLPGSLGGAVFMNARCYDKEFSEIVEKVTAITAEGNLKNISNQAINFKYKQSIFQINSDFIYSIDLKLTNGDKKTIKKNIKKYITDRKIKKQFSYPSCGSVFKNDYHKNIIAGKLIDMAGLKGMQIGGAKIYERHANFIINYKKATAQDIYNLIQYIKNKIYFKFQIKLEEEIRYIGNFNYED